MMRISSVNSVGVQQLRQIVELLRSSELAGYIIKPRAAHGVIQIYRLRRLAKPENKHITAMLNKSDYQNVKERDCMLLLFNQIKRNTSES